MHIIRKIYEDHANISIFARNEERQLMLLGFGNDGENGPSANITIYRLETLKELIANLKDVEKLWEKGE